MYIHVSYQDDEYLIYLIYNTRHYYASRLLIFALVAGTCNTAKAKHDIFMFVPVKAFAEFGVGLPLNQISAQSTVAFFSLCWVWPAHQGSRVCNVYVVMRLEEGSGMIGF